MIDFSAEEASVTHVGSWNISRNAIIWDRNCLFSSVAVNLKSQLHERNADFKNILDDLGINHEKSIYQIATVLRKVVVYD